VSTGVEALAGTVQRLAVLLSAGVPPRAAWGYLDTDDPYLTRAAQRIAGGADIPVALAESAPTGPAITASAWRCLAAAWAVGADAGAPLAPTLRDVAHMLRTLAATERDIRTALTGPRATAKVVMVLPPVGVLFGSLLGFDTLRVLFTTPPGMTCLAAGLLLLAGAWSWNRRLVRRATPSDATPGLECELLAIAVSGGSPIPRARQMVTDAMDEFGANGRDAAVDDVLSLSERAGVPAAELLRSEASEARRRAAAEAQRAAEALGVTLMLPLGLCILPAFILLGVLPVLVAVVTSTLSTF
jgi:tight adherence protein B